MLDYIRMLILVHKQKKDMFKCCAYCKYCSDWRCKKLGIRLYDLNCVCKRFKISKEEIDRLKGRAKSVISKFEQED